MSGDAAVAVLDGGSDGPAEGQNEAPENAMEPEARAFDPEVFLSLSGHTSVAGPPGEVNGGGSPVPVAGPEVVAAERNVSEPEVVQGISGTGGGDFDDVGFGPVDEKSVPLPPADGGGSGARRLMLATPRSSVRWSPVSLWPQRSSPGAVRQANVHDTVLAEEASQLLGLVAEGHGLGRMASGISGTGAPCRGTRPAHGQFPGLNGPPFSSRRFLSLPPPSAMCLTHLRRVPADDATTTGWVSSILLLPPIFNSRLTCLFRRRPPPG